MCYFCGDPIAPGRKFGFSETCHICGKDMHVCVQCTFYLPGAHWDCRETIDALVADKTKRNYCEWFSLHPRLLDPSTKIKDGRVDENAAKSAFSALFGD